MPNALSSLPGAMCGCSGPWRLRSERQGIHRSVTKRSVCFVEIVFHGRFPPQMNLEGKPGGQQKQQKVTSGSRKASSKICIPRSLSVSFDGFVSSRVNYIGNDQNGTFKKAPERYRRQPRQDRPKKEANNSISHTTKTQQKATITQQKAAADSKKQHNTKETARKSMKTSERQPKCIQRQPEGNTNNAFMKSACKASKHKNLFPNVLSSVGPHVWVHGAREASAGKQQQKHT